MSHSEIPMRKLLQANNELTEQENRSYEGLIWCWIIGIIFFGLSCAVVWVMKVKGLGI